MQPNVLEPGLLGWWQGHMLFKAKPLRALLLFCFGATFWHIAVPPFINYSRFLDFSLNTTLLTGSTHQLKEFLTTTYFWMSTCCWIWVIQSLHWQNYGSACKRRENSGNSQRETVAEKEIQSETGCHKSWKRKEVSTEDDIYLRNKGREQEGSRARHIPFVSKTCKDSL